MLFSSHRLIHKTCNGKNVEEWELSYDSCGIGTVTLKPTRRQARELSKQDFHPGQKLETKQGSVCRMDTYIVVQPSQSKESELLQHPHEEGSRRKRRMKAATRQRTDTVGLPFTKFKTGEVTRQCQPSRVAAAPGRRQRRKARGMRGAGVLCTRGAPFVTIHDITTRMCALFSVGILCSLRTFKHSTDI